MQAIMLKCFPRQIYSDIDFNDEMMKTTILKYSLRNHEFDNSIIEEIIN